MTSLAKKKDKKTKKWRKELNQQKAPRRKKIESSLAFQILFNS